MRRPASPSSRTAPRSWLLALLLALAPAVLGAPADSTADAPKRSGTDDAAAPEPAANEAPDRDPGAERGAGPSPEVFVPSEDISEDFAVPFPVDI